MPIVPRGSVRVQLAVVVLITILLSWVLSGGIANYLNYLNLRALRQEMMKRPDIFPRAIPEPGFGVREFFIGRPPGPPRLPDLRRAPPPGGPGLRPPPPGPSRPPAGPQGPPPGVFQTRWLLLRLAVALGLAALAGVWLGRRFTQPLTQLAKGADAFQSGDFAYRIPASGKNEFGAVAAAMNEMARRVSDQIGHLEEDAERRRRFLADIAHELRSPVTTMRTMAGALQDGVADEPERQDRAVSALVGTSERLLRLVQDLIELARLDLNELPLNVQKVNVRELVSAAIHSHDAEAASAHVALHPLSPGPPVHIHVDPDRITQVLDNILENAISYAGAGAEVKVTVEDGDPVKISISDTGKGIPAADLPYVLDAFYRSDTARTPGDFHSGLGLSIASRLIHAHGGSLTISSVEGQGTAVSVTLPKGARSS